MNRKKRVYEITNPEITVYIGLLPLLDGAIEAITLYLFIYVHTHFFIYLFHYFYIVKLYINIMWEKGDFLHTILNATFLMET